MDRIVADTLKRKAAIFLIENMDVHESYVSQTWDNFQSELDSLYTKEDRPSELIKGFNTLYEKYNQGLQDVVYVSDLKTISSQFLIKNIDEAFLAWKSPFAKHLNFQDFCEYILPYRIATEPLADWRTEFNKQFIPDMYSRIRKQKDSISAKDICNALKTYPYGTITFFQSDVPDYNIHTLSVMRLGSCRYYSIQAAFAGRSLGIPVALDNTPQWATRSFGHEWNAFISPDNKPMAFGIGDQVELGKHIENVPDRIPPKIYRETFAKQPSSLFFIKNEELCIYDFNQGRVLVFAPSGRYLRTEKAVKNSDVECVPQLIRPYGKNKYIAKNSFNGTPGYVTPARVTLLNVLV
jgi:hypothetical protein